MSEPILQLYSYTNWANQTLMVSLKQHAGLLPASCLRLFSHITNAQLIWMSRINGIPSPVGVWDEHDLDACEHNHALFASGITTALHDQRSITYTTTQQKVFTDDIQDILLHVFNHGTYHRAQIAQEMRRNGLKPVNTDFIFYKRSRKA